ncbi:hypothetical protein M378DRAFT_171968 [Amanita muscaria Koide BX008]|uniref:Uncharacterized protein n=1 Tax=Amanita muscaria (strain Koide BX008) TaxID=946122 RepID=A0A0C2S3J1_AMAMK|nr:hypothetical protein M378DRAFT_171968 [Amanita muscaria Koide BX008]
MMQVFEQSANPKILGYVYGMLSRSSVTSPYVRTRTHAISPFVSYFWDIGIAIG